MTPFRRVEVVRKLVAVATLSLLVGAGGAYLAGAQAPVFAQTGHAMMKDWLHNKGIH